MPMTQIKWLAVIFLVSALPACSIYSLPGPAPAPIEERPDYGRGTTPDAVEIPGEDEDPIGASAAYGPLLDEAEIATARGDYERALTLLERSQRIDPDNPQIYLAMAETHDARGDYSQARAVAERGLLYCDGGKYCESLRAYTH